MTEELKQAAQAALDQLEFLNACYPHKTATDAADALCRALTLRPAAQTEREAFEATAPIPTPAPPFATYDEHGNGCDDEIQDFYYRHCQEVETRAFNRGYDAASLPAPQQATPEPVGDVRCEGCGYMTHHREHMGCVRAAKQLTRPAPAIDIKAAAGKLMGWSLPKDFSPDNGIRFTPPSFGWPTGTNLLNVQQAEQMLAYVLEGVDRPAQGVPDGLEEQIMEALRDGLSVCMSVSVSRDRKISRDGCTLYAQTEEWCRWLDAEVGPKIRAAVDALAAAQAKGDAHD